MEALLFFLFPLFIFVALRIAIWRDVDTLVEEKKLYRLGIHLYDTGKYEAVIDYFNTIISEQKKSPSAYYYRALAHFQIQNFHSCIYDCNQAVKFTNDLPEAHLLQSRSYLKLKDYESALSQIDIYISLKRGKNSDGYRWKGIILYQMNQQQAAQIAFKKASTNKISISASSK